MYETVLLWKACSPLHPSLSPCKLLFWRVFVLKNEGKLI